MGEPNDPLGLRVGQAAGLHAQLSNLQFPCLV
jgi:hypothetical protein